MVLRLESRFSHMLGKCLISDKGAQVVFLPGLPK